MAFAVLKGCQPWRQSLAEGEASCWCRARSWGSCLWSRSALQVWVQGAWWAVAKQGGGCVAQSVLHFTVPQPKLPSVEVYGTRHPTPKPAKHCESSGVMTALVTSQKMLRPHRAGPHTPFPPGLSPVGCWHRLQSLTDFFLFHGWTHSSWTDPADSSPFFYDLYILAKCFK